MIKRKIKRKGPGALEYILIGIVIGFFIAGGLVKSTRKHETQILTPIVEVQATASATSVVIDERPDRLYRFFNRYSSPLATLSAEIVRYADDYKIDYRVVPAIAGAESTFCKNYRVYTNNCFGYGPHWTFPSIERAIKKVSWQIGETNLYKDWQANPGDIGKLARVYTQSDQTAWEATVREFMSEIER